MSLMEQQQSQGKVPVGAVSADQLFGSGASSAASSGDPNINSIISNLSTGIDKDVLQRAFTPVVAGHSMQLPTSLQRESLPFQPAPMDHREVVGAGNARGQGIGNAITGVANALGSFVSAQAKIKHDQLRDAATKVITAQSSIDEAQKAYDEAKTSGDTASMEVAQKELLKNTKTRDDTFADPKLSKALQKGFNISYTDPSANKTEEHAAVQAAMKQAKTIQEKKEIVRQQQAKQNQARGAAMGEAFAKSQPTQMGPNLQAQARLAAQQEQQKQRVESVKALIPYLTEMKKAGTEISKELIVERSASRVAAIDAQGKLDAVLAKNKQEGINNAASLELERLRGAEARLTASATAGDPRTIMKDFEATSDQYLKHLEANQTERTTLNKELDTGSLSQSRQQEIRAQLRKIDDQDTTARSSFEMARNFAASQAGVKVQEMPVPTPHVGDGVNATSGAAKSTDSGHSSNINPFTGQSFGRDTSSVERALIKVIHGGESIYKEATTDKDPEDKGIVGRILSKQESKPD